MDSATATTATETTATETEAVLGASGTDSTPQENLLGGAGTEEAKGEGAEEPAPKPATEITLPDGAEIDADLLEAMKEGDPQKYADAFLAHEQKRAEGWAKQQKEWVAEVKKEWGDKADHNLNLANRALQKFGSEELAGFFKTTGLANHPEMIKLFHRIASADAEDTVAGTAAAPTKSKDTQESLHARWYPNSQG